jgi:hypothetical protein
MEDALKKLQLKMAHFQILTTKDYEFQFCWRIKDAFKNAFRKRFSKKFKLGQACDAFSLSYIFPTRILNFDENAFNEMFKTEIYIILSHPTLPSKKIAGRINFQARYFVLSSHVHFRQKFFLSNCPDKGAYVEFDISTSIPRSSNTQSPNMSFMKRSASNQSFSNSVNNDTMLNVSNLSYISVESVSDDHELPEERSKSQPPLLFSEDFQNKKNKPVTSLKPNNESILSQNKKNVSPTKDLTDGDYEFSLDDISKQNVPKKHRKGFETPKVYSERNFAGKIEEFTGSLELIQSASTNNQIEMKASNFTFCQPEIVDNLTNESEMYTHELAHLAAIDNRVPTNTTFNSDEEQPKFQKKSDVTTRSANFIKLQQRLDRARAPDGHTPVIDPRIETSPYIGNDSTYSANNILVPKKPTLVNENNVNFGHSTDSITESELIRCKAELKRGKKEIKALRMELELTNLKETNPCITKNQNSDLLNEIKALKATIEAYKIEVK